MWSANKKSHHNHKKHHKHFKSVEEFEARFQKTLKKYDEEQKKREAERRIA